MLRFDNAAMLWHFHRGSHEVRIAKKMTRTLHLAIRRLRFIESRIMSFAEIEAQLERLTPDELRRLALKSWSAFVAREGLSEDANQCDEDDPDLLAALDEAVAQADSASRPAYSGAEVRERIGEWTSK